ncbi:MAG TPA: M14 family zinc carboxypeptidase [Pirellulales bacterium]|nr:M14 family zinc carboxypeptidase [Pirellulales bacterium]
MNSASEIVWHTLARSIEDRVIEYAQFGDGELQALVVAPLAGDESEGGEIVERLANHLAHFPRSLTNTTVTIVRDPNPDGRFRHSAGNARGVLLDQNFATRHWRRTPTGDRWLSGREPESEPETRALVELLADLKPHRILVLGSERNPPSLRYAGPADDLAQEFAQSAHVRSAALDSVDAAGSLAAYAGLDREIPTLVFRVTTRSSAEQNWLHYRRALLTFLNEPAPPTDAPDGTGRPQTEDATVQQEPRRLTTPARSIALQSRADRNQFGSEEDSPNAAGLLSAADLEQGAPLVPVGRPPELSESPVPTAPAGAAIAPPGPPPGAIQPPLPPASPAPHNQPGPSFQIPSLRPGVKTNRPGATIGRPAEPAPRPQPAPNSAQGMFVPPVYPAYPVTPQAHAPRIDARPPAAAPAAESATASPRVQRLPKVDSTTPEKDLRQQPIPFYPDTGY